MPEAVRTHFAGREGREAADAGRGREHRRLSTSRWRNGWGERLVTADTTLRSRLAAMPFVVGP
jgi:hypothetical protein